MTIRDAVVNYKRNIAKYWEQENYKWVAVEHFQKRWDIDAPNFAEMLTDSLSLAFNLLQGGMYYANKMVCVLAKYYPEKIRELFRNLYDESIPLEQRIHLFRSECDALLNELRSQVSGYENAKNHYQDLRAVCVYLSFMYPDKYYLFKYKMYSGFKEAVGFQETSVIKDHDTRKYDNFSILCQEVVREIRSDTDLVKMQNTLVQQNPKYYVDPELHLLAQTIVYINQNPDDTQSLVDRDAAGAAVADEDIKTIHYWIYSPGNGAEIWDECYSNGFMAIGWDEIGNLSEYESKDAMKQAMKQVYDPNKSYQMSAHATWQFVHEMKPGDIVFAKKGMYQIVGRGIVESEYEYDEDRKQYKNVRKVRWTHKGEWQHPGKAVMKTLTDITPYTAYVAQLNSIFDIDAFDDEENQEIEFPAYDAEMFLEEVFMDEASYETLVSLVRTKKNVILQGAPGVGKTFVAKRLAYSMMGEKNPHRVMMVQFHQSYSYEDFVMGFRPNESGFELKTGAFYDFCKTAEIDNDNEYFFIIDEINRGNLSKIFGELFMLIESDKRGVELRLLYSGEKFSVPKNVFIIGMMNTADRSLAMMDFALRRRFAFFEMKPGFKVEGFIKYRKELANDKFNQLISCVEDLNTAISNDDSLGDGFCIGHSFFCNMKQVSDQNLSGIVEHELIPLLKEYWFDEPSKAKEWADKLRGAIK